MLFRSLVYGTELILIHITILHLLGSYSYSRRILIPISHKTHTYSDSSYAVLSLFIYEGTYTHTGTSIYLILVQISHRSYRAYTYTKVLIHVLVLLSILYLFRSPIGVTGLILIQRYSKVLQNLYLYFVSYTCTTEHILVLRILCLYYGAYSCISDLIFVLPSIYLSFGSYTCITDLMPVLQDLFLYYRTYTYITDTEVPVGTTKILLVQKYP